VTNHANSLSLIRTDGAIMPGLVDNVGMEGIVRTWVKAAVVGISVLNLAACAQPGVEAGANVYGEGQVNTRQKAEVVNILAVMPAKVAVTNAQNQQAAQIVGGLLGAMAGAGLGAGLGHHNGLAAGTVGAVGGGIFGNAAGSLVPGEVLIDGVSITYEDHGSTYSSAQVGHMCEYVPGRAIMISTSPTETRIQPNTACRAAPGVA
jgi:outer membrane lipoprotein SlyB